VVRIVRADLGEAVRRVVYQFMAESIHVLKIDVDDFETVPLLMETILCDLEVCVPTTPSCVCFINDDVVCSMMTSRWLRLQPPCSLR
jgi:hypothetical protein